MDAEELRAELIEYLDGSMDEARRSEFELRMQRHPEFGRKVREHQQIDRWFDEIEGSDPSSGQLARMADAILDGDPTTAEERVAPVVSLHWARHRGVQVAAAVVLLLLGAWSFGLFGSDEGASPDRGLADSSPSGSGSASTPGDGAAPGFLDDPEFARDFELIRDLGVIEELGDELVLPEDEQLLDMVTLQVLSGA